MKSSRFGQYLLEQGALDRDQLEEAYLSQSVLGGRIGSNLVELGFMELAELTEHLSRYHKVPVPPEDWLEVPDERALALIPTRVIRRYSVLPLRAEPGRLHVAMLDPVDTGQIEMLRELSRREVVPYVLPEVRLCFWLETHCGIDRHPRYTNLVARGRRSDHESDIAKERFAPLAQGQELSSEDSLVVAPATPPLVAATRERRGRRQTDPVDELVLEEIALVDEVEAQGPPSRPRVPSGPKEIAALEAELSGAGDRNGAIDLALRIGAAFAQNVALFVVRGEMVTGLKAIADGELSRLDGVVLPLSLESLFTQPALTGDSFRGHPPHDGTDGRILEAIGRAEAHEVLIQPVSIRGRVVNLLYADNGSDPFADTCVAALGALAETMSEAYGRLIAEMKRGS